MNFFSRQKMYVKTFAVYALCLLVFQNVLAPLVQFSQTGTTSNTEAVASVEKVAASGTNSPTVYIDCDVNENGSSLGYNNSYMCGQEVQCYGHVSNWNNPIGNNVTYTSSFTIAGGTLVPGSIWTYNDPAFNHGKPGSVTCTATSATTVTCSGTAGTDQDLSGAGETQFESIPDMGFKVLLNACDNNCEDLTINANMNATLVVAPNTQYTHTHAYNHSINGCSNPVTCPTDSDYTATATPNGSSVTIAGTCDASKFSTLSVEVDGQIQNVNCSTTPNYSLLFNGLQGNQTANITGTPVTANCPVVVKALNFSCGVCIDPVQLTVSAPQQTSATSIVITGTIGGNRGVLEMNGVKVPAANINNGVFSIPVTLTPGQSTTFTFVATGNPPCEDKTVAVQISCNPNSCVVNQGDMTIDYSDVNGTNVTVGGYCDDSKINQVKLELFKNSQMIGQPVFVDCINNAWEFEYSNLQQSSTYNIRATSVNKPGCTGVVIKNTLVTIAGPVCTIDETDLSVNTPVVNGQTVTVGGTCNNTEYSNVKVELMMGGNVVATQQVACSNTNTWTATFNNLSHNTAYTIRATTQGNVNSCTGEDVDTVNFNCGGPVCTIDETDLSVNTPVVNGQTVTVGGTCNNTEYSNVKVELMMGGNVVATQQVACSNTNTWTATFNNLSHNTAYTIRATTQGNVNSCSGEDVDIVNFSCGGPVCTIDETDLSVNTPVVNGQTVTVGGTCNNTEYSNVKVELMMGGNVVATQQVACSNTNTWTATFNNLSHNTAYTIRATTQGNVNSCTGEDVDTVNFNCGGPVCTIDETDLSVNTPVVNGQTVTVGGTCNNTEYSNVKVELMMGGNVVATQQVACSNTNTWTATFNNLSHNTAYTIRATTQGNVNSCTGEDVDTVNFNCGGPVCTIDETDLSVNTPVVNGQTVTVGGTCNNTEYSNVKVELMMGGNVVATQQVACSNTNTWTATFNNLSHNTAYTIRATTQGNVNSCTGEDVDTVNFNCGGPVCTIDETDLSVNTPVVNGQTVTVGGTCNNTEYSNVKVELMMGGNVVATQQVACSNTNTWTATFNNLSHNTAYTIRATTQGNVNSCSGEDVDIVNFSCGGPVDVCDPSPVILLVNAPQQTSATSIMITGSVAGSYAHVQIWNPSTNAWVNVQVNPVNGTFSQNIQLTAGNNTFKIRAVHTNGNANCTVEKIITIDCHTSSICNHQLQTGVDITVANVSVNGTTGVVSGLFNPQYVASVYVMYNGIKYSAVVYPATANTHGYTITIPGLPYGTTTLHVIAESVQGSLCTPVSMPVSFTVANQGICMSSGDYTANVSTAGTTATIFGTYNPSTVASIYVVYSGVAYTTGNGLVMNNGNYSIVLQNVVVNTLQSATVYFVSKYDTCVTQSRVVSFTCNHGGACNYPVSDIVLNYSSGQVVTTSGITLQAMVVGYGKTYSINGITGDVVNGQFSRTLALTSGANTFVVQVTSQDQSNCSPITKTIVIYYQPGTTPTPVCSGLAITSLSPVTNTSTYDGTIVIQGTVNIVSGTKIMVSPTNAELTLTSGGVFSGLFSLNIGSQTFVVKATNASGCEVSQSITVTRNSSGGGGGGTIYIGGGNNYCGDGVKRSTEQCDDGNNRNGDGCDMNCYLEAKSVVQPGTTTTINKKLITKKLTQPSTTLRLGTVVAPTVLPKTGGVQDLLTLLLTLMQQLFTA